VKRIVVDVEAGAGSDTSGIGGRFEVCGQS